MMCHHRQMLVTILAHSLPAPILRWVNTALRTQLSDFGMNFRWFSKTYIPDFHLHHLLTGIHCLQQTVKAVNGEQVVTQTKKEEKANVWLLKSHMQWTHRRAVLMKAVLTAARLFPLHCRSDTEQNTQDHYSWERVVIKWHFGCPHSYFWVIYS